MFAGVTMGEENVLCFEYGLVGNVDRGCDFHRIMALQRDAMSVINAMITQASTSRISRRTSRTPNFRRRRSCCETAPPDVNSKKNRDFATIMTPSNSSAVAERRTQVNRKQNAATYGTVTIVNNSCSSIHTINIGRKSSICALYCAPVFPKRFETFIKFWRYQRCLTVCR